MLIRLNNKIIFILFPDCVAQYPFDGAVNQGAWIDTACNQRRNFICEGEPSKYGQYRVEEIFIYQSSYIHASFRDI